MDTADQLVEQMFIWMEQRGKCANKLEELAGELETHRKNCNVSKAGCSSLAVVGSVCLIGAAVATAFTGGKLSIVLGVLGAMWTGLGVGVSSITKVVEHFIESDTMEEAKKAESEVHKETEKIHWLFQKLRKECQKVNPKANADDQDQHAMTKFVGTIANRSVKQHSSRDGPEALGVYMDITSSKCALLVELAGILSFFGLKASGENSKILFDKGAEQLIKDICIVGAIAVLEGGARAVAGALGLAFALPEAINSWKDLIEKNNVTEASKSLRDTADALREINRTLRAQLDKIEKMLE